MNEKTIIPSEVIEKRIFIIRGQKVILDFHIAELYQVETKALKRAVKRNRARFPSDFLFELTQQEYTALRYQLGTLKRGEHSKYLPFAFTEQGIAMLSGVLGSPRAVQVNIAIMRSFVKLREVLATHKDLVRKLAELESKYDAQFSVVFDAIRQLMKTPEYPKKEIGFRVKETKMQYKAKR
jgi:ORF6N domain